ncbi:MAG: ABC transporter [Gammaproteobacteria bacterium]|nr:ABC transporter [Gammaproteobacteria bacterium]
MCCISACSSQPGCSPARSSSKSRKRIRTRNMTSGRLVSLVGLVLIATALLFAVAVISLLPGWRLDLTEDRLFTLAPATRDIVSNLDSPIELTFFYSDSATEDVPQIRTYATRVQELLGEIVIASNGRLSLTMIDPEPFSEDEDLANRFGIQPVPVTQGGAAIYFGLVAAQQLPEGAAETLRISETMPLIRPDQEPFLEYEFVKLITQAANPERTVVALLTELDVDGGFDPGTQQMLQPWFVMDVIRQLYEVRRISEFDESIDEDVDIVMLVHPRDLSDQMLYAIDQHIMRGGEAIVFLDPNADSLVTRSPQGVLVPAGMSSDLPGLLEAWGVEYDSSKVLADSILALRVSMGQGSRPEPHLGMLGIQRANLDGDDIITSRLETINVSSAGVIARAEGAETLFEPLMQSSANSMLMEAALIQDITEPSLLFDEFEPTEASYTLAARISGVVNSAFPDGPPPPPPEEEEEEAGAADEEDAETAAAQDEDADAEAAETAEEEEVAPHIAQSAEPVNIILFADTDLMSDRMWVQVAQFLGQRIPQPFANNGDMIVNALDNLAGGANLASIRSRGTYSRPFNRVIEMQRQADDRLREEEAELLARLADTEAEVARLSQNEEGEPLEQIAPEIQAEIDQFNQEMIDTRRRLRDVQFQLTEDIERLGANLQWLNTLLVPVLLSVLVLGIYLLRARRRRPGQA